MKRKERKVYLYLCVCAIALSSCQKKNNEVIEKGEMSLEVESNCFIENDPRDQYVDKVYRVTFQDYDAGLCQNRFQFQEDIQNMPTDHCFFKVLKGEEYFYEYMSVLGEVIASDSEYVGSHSKGYYKAILEEIKDKIDEDMYCGKVVFVYSDENGEYTLDLEFLKGGEKVYYNSSSSGSSGSVVYDFIKTTFLELSDIPTDNEGISEGSEFVNPDTSSFSVKCCGTPYSFGKRIAKTKDGFSFYYGFTWGNLCSVNSDNNDPMYFKAIVEPI